MLPTITGVLTPLSYDFPPGTRWPTAVAPASALPPMTPDANRWTVASSMLSSVSGLLEAGWGVVWANRWFFSLVLARYMGRVGVKKRS